MFIISANGNTEISEYIPETIMDISLRNRGKGLADREYVVSSDPQLYKVTELGLEEKTHDELLDEGLITEEQWKERKNTDAIMRRREKYISRSDFLFLEYQYDNSETKKKEWLAEISLIKAEEPKV